MKNKRILIASVLKPPFEPRMYEKLGLSLSQNPDKEVHIFGFGEKEDFHSDYAKIHFSGSFKRLTFQRILTYFKFLFLALRIRPQVIILESFELIPFALIYRLLIKSKIIYDVRENYSLNIKSQNIYPKISRAILITYIQLCEALAKYFFDLFIYAEICYSEQLSFPEEKCIVLENKYAGPKISSGNSSERKLAFTGTLHRITGLKRIIELVKSNQGNSYELFISGHMTDNELKADLDSISKLPNVHLNISNSALKPSDIYNTYGKANLLLAPYEIDEANRYKIPTKIYDALALGMTIILSSNPFWEEKFSDFPNVLFHDFDSDLDLENILKKVKSQSFKIDDSAFWNSQSINIRRIQEI